MKRVASRKSAKKGGNKTAIKKKKVATKSVKSKAKKLVKKSVMAAKGPFVASKKVSKKVTKKAGKKSVKKVAKKSAKAPAKVSAKKASKPANTQASKKRPVGSALLQTNMASTADVSTVQSDDISAGSDDAGETSTATPE